MKIFIDSADLQEIAQVRDWGILDGVTTNPSLMAGVGVRGRGAVFAHYQSICQAVEGKPVSAEVISTEYQSMIVEGRRLAEIAKNIVVKVPMTHDGVRALRYFAQKRICTNCTLVFSEGQALLAAKAGASYLSPFIGRLEDTGMDGVALVGNIRRFLTHYSFSCQVLAASIRSVDRVVQCALVRADVVTCPFAVIKDLFNHPLTDQGLQKFLDDYRRGCT